MGIVFPSSLPNELLAEFEPERLLGKPDRAETWLVRRRRSGERAVARIERCGPTSPRDRTRFHDAYLTLRRLRHPALPRLLQGGVTPLSGHYVVHEFVPGASLRNLRRNLDTAMVIEVVAQLIPALYMFHHHRLTHQRITPDKIIIEGLGAECRVRLVDPPISTADDGRRWVPPPYRCPELDEEQRWDGRSDIYGVALSVFEAVTGTHPFPTLRRDGDSYLTVCRDVPSLHRLRPDIPPVLSDLLVRMGSAMATERPVSVLKLHSEIRRARLISRDRRGVDAERVVASTRTPGLEPRGREMVALLPDGWQPTAVGGAPELADVADDLEARLRLRRSRRVMRIGAADGSGAGAEESPSAGVRLVDAGQAGRCSVRGPTGEDPDYVLSVRSLTVDDLRRRLIGLCRGPLQVRRSHLLARWMKWKFGGDEPAMDRFLVQHVTSDEEAMFLDWPRVGATMLSGLPLRWPRGFRNSRSDFPSGIPNRDVMLLKRFCFTAEAAQYLRRLYESEPVPPSRVTTLARQDLAVAQHQEHAYLYAFAEQSRVQAARRIAPLSPSIAERILLRAARITQTKFSELPEKYGVSLPKRFEDTPVHPDLLVHIARLIVFSDAESRNGHRCAHEVYEHHVKHWCGKLRDLVGSDSQRQYHERLLRHAAMVASRSEPKEEVDKIVNEHASLDVVRNESTRVIVKTLYCLAWHHSGNSREAARCACEATRLALLSGQVNQALRCMSNLLAVSIDDTTSQRLFNLTGTISYEERVLTDKRRVAWTHHDVSAHAAWLRGNTRLAARSYLREYNWERRRGRTGKLQPALVNAAVAMSFGGWVASYLKLTEAAVALGTANNDYAALCGLCLADLASILNDKGLAERACSLLASVLAHGGADKYEDAVLLLTWRESNTTLVSGAVGTDNWQELLETTRSKLKARESQEEIERMWSTGEQERPLLSALSTARCAVHGTLELNENLFGNLYRCVRGFLGQNWPSLAASIASTIGWRCAELGMLSEGRAMLDLARTLTGRIVRHGLSAQHASALEGFLKTDVQKRLASWIEEREKTIRLVADDNATDTDGYWEQTSLSELGRNVGQVCRVVAETLMQSGGGFTAIHVAEVKDGELNVWRAVHGATGIEWKKQWRRVGSGEWVPIGGAWRWHDSRGSLCAACCESDEVVALASVAMERSPGGSNLGARAAESHARNLVRALVDFRARAHRESVVAASTTDSPSGHDVGKRGGGKGLVLSDTLVRMMEVVDRLARRRVPVVLVGESGSGKEVLARHAHECSPFHGGPFVAVDCPSVSANLAEAELFGHLRGSFSGALVDREGLIYNASNGTLFLDEVGDLPLDVQCKLLRVLSTSEVRQIGSTKTRRCEFYLVSATNADLGEMVKDGRFRLDLRHRLGVEIRVPALRERADEIMPLWEFFLAEALGGRFSVIEQGVRDLLTEHSWPGNVRELKAVASACGALMDDGHVTTQLVESLLKRTRGEAGQESVQVAAGLPRLDAGLRLVQERGSISRRAYVAALRVSSRTATRDLERMVSEGLIERVGTGRGCRYYLRQGGLASKASATREESRRDSRSTDRE